LLAHVAYIVQADNLRLIITSLDNNWYNYVASDHSTLTGEKYPYGFYYESFSRALRVLTFRLPRLSSFWASSSWPLSPWLGN